MRYYKHYYESPRKDPVEVTYDEALRSVLGAYRDNDMSRDMLTIVNRIKCQFCDVIVKDESRPELILVPNYYNALPMQYRYDDEGNRNV